jgi:acetate kinase
VRCRLIAAGDVDAPWARHLHRLKSTSARTPVGGGIDALSFTAGIGGNDAVVGPGRRRLGFLGIGIDPSRNAERSDRPRVISPDAARVAVMVIPTDEERAIALETMSLVAGASS